MQASLALLRFVAKTALGCAGFGVAGEFVAEVLPDMARSLYKRWAAGRPADEVSAEVRAVARLDDDEARRLATIAADEAGPDVSPDIHLSLVTYLALMPAAIRQTQRGGGDPVIARPADVLKILPARLPRFAKGERARGFADWTLEELLGVGGFGEVWKATNPHLPPVALKFCLDEAAARFLRHEADLLGRIVRQGRHPGVVALLDTALSTDPPCLKYEFVPGGDLAALVKGWSGPAADRARPLLRQLAEAVASAHRLDPPIVHRDIKPANVLVQHDPDGGIVLQVADFGIGAIVASHSLPTAHAPTALLGACTPLYASPQQLRGDEPSPADDVFALGVLWYQLLVGDLSERPGTDWREALATSGAGSDEIDVLGRCLVGRADRRLRDAGALLDALDRLEGHAEEPTPEADEESDDPLDLADRLQRSLREAQCALAQARELAEKRHDYAAAIRRLETIPIGFRDSALMEVYCERRDRVAELRRRIFPAVRRGDFAGLRDRIADLLFLTPGDEKVRRLLEVVPYLPGREVVNGAGMRLMLVPAGTFAMGSPSGEVGRQACEGPARPKTIARPFYLGAHPVTQGEFERIMGTNPARFRHVSGHDTTAFPVENVTWHEADEFCRRLSALPFEKERGRRYRLPTEAEWEYACRAGEASQPFSTGRSLGSAQANFDGRRPYGHAAFGEFRGRTIRVGTFAANAWGLFDMHGNVWEWCADRFDEAGEARVLRGGSWQNHAASCRSASRDWIGPGYRGCTVGFRVVLEIAG